MNNKINGKSDLHKIAALEDSAVSDPKTGKKIRTSTTIRKIYREEINKETLNPLHTMGVLSNKDMNDLIAQEFAASSGGTVHMFLSKSSLSNSENKEWIEIRSAQASIPFKYFLAVRRPTTIDIISAIKEEYKKPSKSRID